MKKLLALAFVSTTLVGAAGAVVIDFNDRAEGETISNQYAGLGVTFVPNPLGGDSTGWYGSSGNALGEWAGNTNMQVTATDVGGGAGTGFGKLLHTFGGWLNEDGDPNMQLSFSTALTSFSAKFLGISAGEDTGFMVYLGNVKLADVRGSGTTSIQTLSYSTGLFDRIVIVPGSFGDWVGVDDITFTAVPEPASMLALGLGLAAVAARRRRK